jgi:hypothetical protein
VNRNTGDYYSEIYFENYEKGLWKKRIIPILPLISIIVYINKPYHHVLLECTPISNMRKVIMINWLSSHGVPYSDAMFKPQLF